MEKNKIWTLLGLGFVSFYLSLSSAREVDPTAPLAYVSENQQTVLIFSVDKSIAQGLLPEELEILPSEVEGQSLLFLIHNQYLNLRGVNPDTPPIQYDELLTYVPNLKLKKEFRCGGATPRSVAYMPKLYLNHPVPVQTGVDYYGFNKNLAEIQASNTSFEVSLDNAASPFYSAQFGEEEALTSKGFMRFKKIAQMLPSALVGKKADGSITWSGFNFGLDQASVKSIKMAQVDAESVLLGNLHLKKHGINHDFLGAYRIRSTVSGTHPLICQRD